MIYRFSFLIFALIAASDCQAQDRLPQGNRNQTRQGSRDQTPRGRRNQTPEGTQTQTQGTQTQTQTQTQFYVSPLGTPTGDGSQTRPWDLKTALAHPPSVKPGDTIWLRGGTYRGLFVSTLKGTPEAPIIVRQYPSEKAILDGGTEDGGILAVAGAYTWYWGFEVTSSSKAGRFTVTGTLNRGVGVYTVQQPGAAVGTKFINLTVHDTAMAFGIWKEAENAEVYGCIVFNNGWDMIDRGHGHGIYAQNQTGTTSLIDNILFNQYSHGIHIYGSENAYLNNYRIEGNIVFNNGGPSEIFTHGSGYARNILIGGGRVAENIELRDNYTYYNSKICCGVNDLGYEAGIQNLRATGNYFINGGDSALRLTNLKGPAVISGNTLFGIVEGFLPSQIPGNTYYSKRPTANEVFVRPNRYEPSQAHVVIYNWEMRPTVTVNVSSIGLVSGDKYTIRNVLNYFGTPITGTYDGHDISIPMDWPPGPGAETVAENSLPEFGVFIISK